MVDLEPRRASPYAICGSTCCVHVQLGITNTAHVDTAVTFVRNLKWQATELEFDDIADIERIYRCLNEITTEKVGKALFSLLCDEVVENWAKVENVVQEKATAAEGREVKFALQRMFEDVRDEDLPDFKALRKPAVRGEGNVNGRGGRYGG